MWKFPHYIAALLGTIRRLHLWRRVCYNKQGSLVTGVLSAASEAVGDFFPGSHP